MIIVLVIAADVAVNFIKKKLRKNKLPKARRIVAVIDVDNPVIDLKTMTRMSHLFSHIHRGNESRGFWEEEENVFFVPYKIWEIAQEAAEASDAHKKGRKSKASDVNNLYGALVDRGYMDDQMKLFFESNIKGTLGDELADVWIRTADLSTGLGIDLAKSIMIKLAYNDTRAYKHGNKY